MGASRLDRSDGSWSVGDGQWTMVGGQWTRTVDNGGEIGFLPGSMYKGCVKKKGKERKAQVGEERPPLYRHNVLHDIPCSGNP